MKASPLADSIDPKAFVMMISTNFHILHRGGTLHLSPLWDALLQKHAKEQLIGMFLKFEEAARELSIPVVLPPPVAALDHELRQIHLLHFAGIDPAAYRDPSGLTPLVNLEVVETPLEPIPMLTTGDLKPLITDDLRRKVSQSVAQAVRASPLGQRVEPAQVAYMIDTNFEQLCDGARFDFRPVHDALVDLGGVSDADIYAVVIRLQDALGTGMELILHPLNVDVETASAIAQRMRAKPSHTSDPRLGPVSPPAAAPQQAPKEEDARPNETRKDAQLRQLGIGESKRNWKAIRIGMLSAVLLAFAVVAFLTRPNRSLDHTEFEPFPLKSAQLVEGTVQGVLDEARWFSLKFSEREDRVRALTQHLQATGRLSDIQVRDAAGNLVVTYANGRVLVAPSLKKNLPAGDTTAPKEASAKTP